MELFDPYEIRARLAPTLVVFSPLILVVVAALMQAGTPGFATSSVAVVVLAALLYTCSFVVRKLGQRIEGPLWESWGGARSAVLLTDSDPAFTAATKRQVLDELARVLGIDLGATVGPSDLTRAQEAFGRVRQYIRQKGPDGVWSSQNAEYGFLRNLLGSWAVLMTNGIVASVIGGVVWYRKGFGALSIAALAGALLAVVALVCCCWGLPPLVRDAADRYAESAWLCFLSVVASREQNRGA